MSVFYFLNEIITLDPPLLQLIVQGRNVMLAREVFERIGGRVRDLDDLSEPARRENRASRNVAVEIGRRIESVEEQIEL